MAVDAEEQVLGGRRVDAPAVELLEQLAPERGNAVVEPRLQTSVAIFGA